MHTPLHSECGVSDVKLYTFSCCSCSPSFHAHPVKHGSISSPIRPPFHHSPRLTLVSANSRRISFSSSTKRFRPQLGHSKMELHISCNLEHFKENCLCSWVIQTYYYTHACPMKTVMLKVVHAESPQVGLTITIRPFWSFFSQFPSPDVRANHSLQKSYYLLAPLSEHYPFL